MSETVDRPTLTTPARAYAMQALEEQDAPDVIASMYSLFNIQWQGTCSPEVCDLKW